MTRFWRKSTFYTYFEDLVGRWVITLEGWLEGRVFCILSAHALTSFHVLSLVMSAYARLRTIIDRFENTRQEDENPWMKYYLKKKNKEKKLF